MSPFARPLPPRRPPARRPARGFTLVEVMIAVGIGLLVLAGLTMLFANHARNNGEREGTGRQLESARYALDTLATDLRHAGFYGEFNPNDLGPAYSDPDPCTNNLLNLGWNTAGVAVTLPAPLRGTPAAGALACLQERLAGTEAVTVRRASTGGEQTLASMVADNLYLQVSRCADDVQQVAAAATAAGLVLRNIGCTAAVDAVRRYVTRTYYVARCNDCAANDGIPTLKRVELVNGELRTTAVAEGIENLQIEYGVDTDVPADGAPNVFVPAADIDGNPVTHVWTNVMAVRVHLLSRNTEPSAGYTDPRTYAMGAVSVTPATVSPAAAAYKRTLMTETVRLVNVGDRHDQ